MMWWRLHFGNDRGEELGCGRSMFGKVMGFKGGRSFLNR